MSLYLDWAASSPPESEIIKDSYVLSCEAFGNPSSIHEFGRESAKYLSIARERAASCLGVLPQTLYFTSGGTESNHIPLISLIQRPVKGSIAISSIEHPAIIEQARMLELQGWKILPITCDTEGFISPETVVNTIQNDTALVAVMAVNNETGAIQRVEEIGKVLQNVSKGKRKLHFHVDAVQAIGKIPFSCSTENIDSVAISAHKIGGPKGTGILYLNHRIEPFIRGGGQENGLRPGTENLAGAWAISLCLEKTMKLLAESSQHTVMNTLIQNMRTIEDVKIIPETRLENDTRFSPWILQVTNSKIPGEVLVRSFSDHGIYISTGSACSARKNIRPVLEAMKVSIKDQKNAIRISFGNSTKIEDILSFTDIFQKILQTL